jgi:plastocyanin
MPVVHIKDIEFTPAVVHVRKDARVRWEWEDAYLTHVVASRGEHRFPGSGPRRQGARYSAAFHRRGTYRYVCTIHPNMHGRVVVHAARAKE